MFSRLFGRSVSRSPSRTPKDCVVWAVGDIHGRADLSGPLLSAIVADLDASSATRRAIVLLGDYVDLAAQSGPEVHCLRGNHEDRMAAFLEDPAIGPAWCDFGGRECLVSYGVVPPVMRGDLSGWAQASASLKDALPDSHRRLLHSLSVSVEIGDYFFAHAGARPGVALSAQSPDDLMWIRQEFLDHQAPFEKVVVHGHTPADAVVSDDRRIGLDTGAYATNVLSAVRLAGETRVLLQATGRGEAVSLSTTALRP